MKIYIYIYTMLKSYVDITTKLYFRYNLFLTLQPTQIKRIY